MRKICTAWNHTSYGWTCLVCFPHTPNSLLTLLVCFLSLSLFLPFSLTLSLCQTFALHSLFLLTSSLKPTPWQPVAASPRKVDSLSVVPQQPNATSDSEACCIINQKQPRGAGEEQIAGRRDRMRGSALQVPHCWLLQCKLKRSNNTSTFDLPCMTTLAESNTYADSGSESETERETEKEKLQSGYIQPNPQGNQ